MKKLLLLFVLFQFQAIAQNSVTGTFVPAEEYLYAFLYKATPEGAEYIDRGKLERDGSFSIQLNGDATPGIYKIVYALPAEENNFDFIYNGKENVDFEFSTKNGVVFKDSNENKLWSSYLRSIAMVNQTISNYYSKEQKDEAAFKAIFKTLVDTQNAYEESAKDMIVSTFIIANRPYIPAEYEDMSTYSMNLKDNYLKNIDFNNYILQCSSFLSEHILTYVFNMVDNASNDTYKLLVDELVQSMNNTTLVIKSNLLTAVWLRYTDLNNATMANYVTDTYLLKLAQSSKNTFLEERLTAYKNTSIGAIAPNFDINLDGTNSSLHDLKGTEHYLLIFWSSACGHCLDELPQVKSLIEGKSDLKIIAFGLEDDENGWLEEKSKYPDFIHVLGLGKWDNSIVKQYDIAATPSYFILDNDKRIIAKPYELIDLEQELQKL